MLRWCCKQLVNSVGSVSTPSNHQLSTGNIHALMLVGPFLFDSLGCSVNLLIELYVQIFSAPCLYIGSLKAWYCYCLLIWYCIFPAAVTNSFLFMYNFDKNFGSKLICWLWYIHGYFRLCTYWFMGLDRMFAWLCV